VAKDLAAEYGASVEVKDFEGSAWGYVRGHRIVLKPKYAKDPDTLIGMVMHECGHIHCMNNGLWQAYHNPRNKRAFRLTAWKAEKWIDRWAKAQLRKRFPGVKYKNGYTKSDYGWFKREVIESYR